MRTLSFTLAMIGAMAITNMSQATIPANPRTIAGVDEISPHWLGDVLSRFCKENGCISRFLGEDNGNYSWNFYWGNGLSPASVGSGCAGIPHRYCVQTHGEEGKAFMGTVRTLKLKKMLEAKGAKVVLMDCRIEPTSHGFGYLCANGKPPP